MIAGTWTDPAALARVMGDIETYRTQQRQVRDAAIRAQQQREEGVASLRGHGIPDSDPLFATVAKAPAEAPDGGSGDGGTMTRKQAFTRLQANSTATEGIPEEYVEDFKRSSAAW